MAGTGYKFVAIPLSSSTEEDVVWDREVQPLLPGLPPNVVQICRYGFTEICNNAIDHSEGKTLYINVFVSDQVWIMLGDDGVGIFRKLCKALGLASEEDAILELSKGKLTTDRRRHTGEGIFFTSRMFDSFVIRSRQAVFSRGVLAVPDGFRTVEAEQSGTVVMMGIDSRSSRTTKQVFDMYSVGEDYEFKRTDIQVRLAQPGDPELVSRSQAKRLLARLEQFSEVSLDFDGIESIGQAFADEIFRVYADAHPEVKMTYMNASQEVERMINRAMKGREA